MDPILIYLDGVPGSKQRPQFARHSGGVRTFSRPKTIKYEARLADAGRDAWPFSPLLCPIKLTLTAVFPVAVSWPKWRRALASLGKLWHVGKPDLDNAIKIACDGLNDVVWHDDSQVCWIDAKKFYGDTPGMWLSIETLDDTGGREPADDAPSGASMLSGVCEDPA
jgi:Holliday junction resolvase RusA-like endonuclease